MIWAKPIEKNDSTLRKTIDNTESTKIDNEFIGENDDYSIGESNFYFKISPLDVNT